MLMEQSLVVEMITVGIGDALAGVHPTKKTRPLLDSVENYGLFLLGIGGTRAIRRLDYN